MIDKAANPRLIQQQQLEADKGVMESSWEQKKQKSEMSRFESTEKGEIW